MNRTSALAIAAVDHSQRGRSRGTLATAIVLILAAAIVPLHAPRALAAEGTLYAVSGSVHSDSGDALPGAVVYAYVSTPDGSSSTSDKATVGEDGTFVLHLGDGVGSINVYYEKWPQAASGREIKVSGADVKGLDFVLQAPPPKTAILEGRVLDANGNPIEGATVQLGYGCCVMYAKGGEAVATPPPAPDAAPGASDANATTTTQGSSSSGAAEPSMPIRCCCCPYYNDQDSAVTGPDGAFKLASYGGSHSLTATAKGYAQSQIQVETKDNATVKQDIKLLKVPKADAVIEGRVLDAKTGLPVANAGVSLNNLEWSRYLYATTGADGKFRFETALPGWTEIDVYVQQAYPIMLADGIAATDAKMAAPQQTYYAYSRTLTIESGTNAVDVKLQPKSEATVVLTGYVVDPTTKKGVEGATVNVWDQDTGDWGSATTDATGSYKMLVRTGHFTMNAYAPGHLNGATTFVIGATEKAKRVDIETPAGESHYAPCEDADCRGYPEPMAYSMDASKGVATSSGSTSAGAPEQSGAKNVAPAPSAPTTTQTTSATGPSAGPDTTRAAAFSGTGGGLPAYDADSPEAAAAANGGTDAAPGDASTAAKKVSALGIILVIGIAAMIAIATQQRRRR